MVPIMFVANIHPPVEFRRRVPFHAFKRPSFAKEHCVGMIHINKNAQPINFRIEVQQYVTSVGIRQEGGNPIPPHEHHRCQHHQHNANHIPRARHDPPEPFHGDIVTPSATAVPHSEQDSASGLPCKSYPHLIQGCSLLCKRCRHLHHNHVFRPGRIDSSGQANQ